MAARDYTTVSIAAGEALSNAVDLDGYTLVGLVGPAVWTSADFTFAVAVHNGRQDFDFRTATYYPLIDATGTETIVVNAAGVNRYYALSPLVFAGARFIKIRSGAVGSATNQVAAATVRLVLADV